MFGFIKSKLDGTERIYTNENVSKIPESYSYRKVLPKVLNQGSDPICVPCSISAIINWKENLKDGSNKDNKVALFDIYRSKKTYGDGMTFKDAFAYLSEKGVKIADGKYKMKDFALVKSIVPLKMALIANGPCVGALPVYSYESMFWDGTGKKKRDILGYHAISIVGYNDKGFIIRNSWGTSFADDGYTVLPYSHFRYFCELWTILD